MIVLPYPPSVNKLYVGWGKNRRRTPRYNLWRGEADVALARQLDGKQEVPAGAEVYIRLILVVPSDGRRHDLDNCRKAVYDCLADNFGFDDDQVWQDSGAKQRASERVPASVLVDIQWRMQDG